MDLEITTIISGIVLLLVFALVGWNLRRKRSNSEKPGSKNEH
ncbi:hypothetical protein [uncultured Porticoccus sp.]|nr:hypothetical protein [uncultured Porticoccus sp.]